MRRNASCGQCSVGLVHFVRHDWGRDLGLSCGNKSRVRTENLTISIFAESPGTHGHPGDPRHHLQTNAAVKHTGSLQGKSAKHL